MKLLHVAPIHFNSPTGMSTSVIELGNGLVRNGFSAGILSACPSVGKIKTLMTVLPSPNSNHFNPWDISTTWITTIEQKFGRPDLINFHDIYTPFETSLARLVKKHKGWPYIVSPRGAFSFKAQRMKIIKKLMGNILFNNQFMNSAAAIHALTEKEAEEIAHFFPKAKLLISPNGVSEDLLSIEQRYTPITFPEKDNNTIFLVFLGRIAVYHKGIDLLLKALQKVQIHNNQNICLLMIGNFATSEDEKIVKALINSLLRPQAVKLIAPLMGEKKWPYMLAGDVFVHTSRFEGMPNAVLEAMALGKPCLVTPGTNMGDIISTNKAGWLVDASSDLIAESILNIAANRKEIKTRGMQAKEYVRKNLMWDCIAMDYVQQLKKIL